MHRIHRLEVKGLGPFDHLDLEFPDKKKPELADLHLFTGQNGTGKTTLLHVLAAFLGFEEEACTQQVLARRHSEQRAWYAVLSIANSTIVMNAGSTNACPARLDVVNRSRTTLFGSNIQFQQYGENRDFLSASMAKASIRQQFPVQIRNERFPCAAFAYSGMRQTGSVRVDVVRELEASPFQDALTFSAGNASQMLQWVANSLSKEALFEKRSEPERAHDLSAARRQIEMAVGEMIGVDVEFVLEIDPVDIQFRVGATTVPFGVLPDGLKSILSWLADLIMRLDRIPWAEERPMTEQPFVLLLDEVDVHLHPAWQRKILPVVQRLFPNAQIFATTHSPFVVGSVASGWIYRFDLDAAGHAQLHGRFEAEAGNSVDWILDEIFGVPQQFDVETEKQLDQLRQRRKEVLASRGQQGMEDWRSLVDALMQRGEEVSAIAASEDRQVKRLLREAQGRDAGLGAAG